MVVLYSFQTRLLFQEMPRCIVEVLLALKDYKIHNCSLISISFFCGYPSLFELSISCFLFFFSHIQFKMLINEEQLQFRQHDKIFTNTVWE